MTPPNFVAFACSISLYPKSSLRQSAQRCRFRATADEATASSGVGGVNVSKYKSQRSVILTDKKEITPDEINNLMVKAGQRVRLLQESANISIGG